MAFVNVLRASGLALLVFGSACGGFGGPRPYSYTLKGLCEAAPRETIPASPTTGEVTVPWTSSINLDPRIPKVEGETIEVFLETITLTAGGGVSDFNFVKSIAVRARTPGTGALVELATYTDDPAQPAPSPLTLTTVMTTDLSPLLNNKVLAIQVELTVTPPQVEWTIDTEGCFTIKASGTRDLFGGNG